MVHQWTLSRKQKDSLQHGGKYSQIKYLIRLVSRSSKNSCNSSIKEVMKHLNLGKKISTIISRKTSKWLQSHQGDAQHHWLSEKCKWQWWSSISHPLSDCVFFLNKNYKHQWIWENYNAYTFDSNVNGIISIEVVGVPQKIVHRTMAYCFTIPWQFIYPDIRECYFSKMCVWMITATQPTTVKGRNRQNPHEGRNG